MVSKEMTNQGHQYFKRVEVRVESGTLDAFRKLTAAAGVSMNAGLVACMVAAVDGVVGLENARRPKALIVQRLAPSHAERSGRNAG